MKQVVALIVDWLWSLPISTQPEGVAIIKSHFIALIHGTNSTPRSRLLRKHLRHTKHTARYGHCAGPAPFDSCVGAPVRLREQQRHHEKQRENLRWARL